MKVITEGHKYVANHFEDKEKGHIIQFIHKELVPNNLEILEDGSTILTEGKLQTINDGTTNEEVLEILIDRMNYLQSKFPCKENACCITHLEEALMWLEKRTRDRVKRGVEGKQIQ